MHTIITEEFPVTPKVQFSEEHSKGSADLAELCAKTDGTHTCTELSQTSLKFDL